MELGEMFIAKLDALLCRCKELKSPPNFKLPVGVIWNRFQITSSCSYYPLYRFG